MKRLFVQKKYISQDDAEFVAEWYNLVNKLNTGIISEQIKELFEKSDKYRIKAHKIIVNSKNWKFHFDKKRNLKCHYEN